jgi:hypothetical protein
LHGERRPRPAQMWLLSPSLLLVYVPVFSAALVWPMVVGSVAFLDARMEQQARTLAQQRRQRLIVDAQRPLVATLEAKIKAMRAAFANPSESPEYRKLEAQLKSANEVLAATRSQAYLARRPGGWGPGTDRFAAATGIGTGVWWLILGQSVWWRPAWVRHVFRPFADRYRGRSGLFLSLIGLVVLAAGALLAMV